MKNHRDDPDHCRQVFFNADDLGMNRGVTDGIMRGFREGLLTGTSLLANAPDADRALWLWKKLLFDQAAARLPLHTGRARLEDPFERFDLGVHLNLTQGRPLSGGDYPDELLDRDGRFPGIFGLFARLQRHGVRLCRQIQAELALQVEFIIDRGAQPTHLNGHQYIELLPVVADFVPQLMKRYGIRAVRVAEEDSLLRTALLHSRSPRAWILARLKRFFARRFHRRMDHLEVLYPGSFHGTAHAGKINMPLIRLFLGDSHKSCPVEIGLHPAEETRLAPSDDDSDGWTDPLASDRPNELRLLTSPELAEYLEARRFRLGRLWRLGRQSKLAAA
jgi:chitin disaccharide deacetylase